MCILRINKVLGALYEVASKFSIIISNQRPALLVFSLLLNHFLMSSELRERENKITFEIQPQPQRQNTNTSFCVHRQWSFWRRMHANTNK